MAVNPSKQERALLIGIQRPEDTKYHAKESLSELSQLAVTSGLDVINKLFFVTDEIRPSTYLGKGRLEKIKQVVVLHALDVVVFDIDLHPRQSSQLENELGCKIIDRTGLILHIFAQRARSRAGKLQVELAQLNYLLPRLVGHWTHFSRQRGGIGTQGPGETQLEVDRRRVRERIHRLKNELVDVEKTRALHREKRQCVPIPVVTLIGYTNAGKSTFFNSLAGTKTQSGARLFETLDPKTKHVRLPSGRMVLLTDTVGFIRRLPHEIVEAFKATFEEAAHSDCLIHVVDGSHPACREQEMTVRNVLREMNMDQHPTLTILNKSDVEPWHAAMQGLETEQAVKVSALTGLGIPRFLLALDEMLSQQLLKMSLFLPYPYGPALSRLYVEGRVLSSRALPQGMHVEVEVNEKLFSIYRQYQLLPAFDQPQAALTF